MTHAELIAKLAARQALIVHFSHHATMRGTLHFPIDLQQVLADNPDWALSCSVLTPGHKMSVVGSVGVMLEPRSAQDVLRVYHDDAGAFSIDTEDHSDGALLSQASFDASLDTVADGRYNEWRVRGAKPIGVFVSDPNHIEVRESVSLEGPWGLETAIGLVQVDLDYVRAALPGWPIWTMTGSGAMQI